MVISEFVFPLFKQDAESVAELGKQSEHIFGHFREFKDVKHLFLGNVIFDKGEPVPADSGRGFLGLGWDSIESFHAVYPNSDVFHRFIGSVKPFLAGAVAPALFETESASKPCLLQPACQVLKGPQNSKAEWAKLRDAVAKLDVQEPEYLDGNGVDKEEGQFLGLIGWKSVEDYERASKDAGFASIVKALVGDSGIDHVVKGSEFDLKRS
jgi:hypothetical protein